MIQNGVAVFLLSQIPTLIFILIMLLSTFIGYKRGLMKSSILLLHAVMAFVICAIIYALLSNQDFFNYAIVKYINYFLGENGLQNKLGVDVELNNLIDILISYFMKNESNALLNVFLGNSSYFVTLAECVLRIVLVFVIYPLYLLLIFIGYIIYRIYHKKKKSVNEYNLRYASGLERFPYNPHKKLGALIGAIRGLIFGLFFLTILGAPLYLVYSNDKRNEYLNDVSQTAAIKDNINLYNNIKIYSKSGIYEVLNNVCDREGLPYYLYVADYIMSGDLRDEKHNIDKNVYLYSELENLLKFADNGSALVFDYIDISFYDHLKNDDKNAIWNDIYNVFLNEEFQKEFTLLYKMTNKDTFIVDLTYSFANSILSNIEVLNLNSPAIEEPINILFKEGFHSSFVEYEASRTDTLDYIDLRNLLTRNDLNILMDIIFDVINISRSSGSDISLIEDIVNYVEKLDFISSDNKTLNNTMRRLYGYLINVYLNKPTYYKETRIHDKKFDNVNFIEETKLILNAIPHALNIYNHSLKGVEIKKNNYLDILFSLKDQEISIDYDIIYYDLTHSSLLEVVLESGFISYLFKDFTSRAFDSFYLPKETNYLSLVNLFNAILSEKDNKEIISYLTNNSVTSENFDSYKRQYLSLYYSNLHNYINESDISRSFMTAILRKANGFVYIDNSIYLRVDNQIVYTISEEDSSAFLKNINSFFSLAEPFVKGIADDLMVNEFVHDKNIIPCLESRILEGTITKLIFENNYFDSGIKVPSNIKYVSGSTEGELKKLIRALEIFDYDINNLDYIDFDYIYSNLSNKDKDEIKIVLDSDFMYSNISNQIYNSANDSFKDIVIPDNIIEDFDNFLIKKSVLIDFIYYVDYIYDIDYEASNILANIIKNKDILFVNCNAKDIFILSAANFLVNNNNACNIINEILIPNVFKLEANPSVIKGFNNALWKDELYSFISGLSKIMDIPANYHIDYSLFNNNLKDILVHNKIDEINYIYDSFILSYNLSNLSYNYLKNTLDVNSLNYIYINVYNPYIKEKIIDKNELINALNVFSLLNINLSEFDVDTRINISNLNDLEDDIPIYEYICLSYISKALVTISINEYCLNNGIVIPSNSYESIGDIYYNILKDDMIISFANSLD